MFGSILPLMRMAGMGRRRRVRRTGRARRVGGRKRVSRRRVGGRKMRMMIQGSGRRRRTRRRMRGMGIFDTIKNIGRKAINIARSVPIISTGLKLAGQDKYADAAKSIGLGRRRKRRYGGRMSVYGGRRRRYRRLRVGGRRRRYRKRRYGGKRRATKRRFSLFGGRKRRIRGRGILSGLISGLLGGRRRTYRTGLLSRRR